MPEKTNKPNKILSDLHIQYKTLLEKFEDLRGFL